MPKVNPVHTKTKYAVIEEYSSTDNKRGLSITLTPKYTPDHLPEVTQQVIDAWAELLDHHPDYQKPVEFKISKSVGKSRKKLKEVSSDEIERIKRHLLTTAISQSEAYTARKQYEETLTHGQKVKHWLKNHWKQIAMGVGIAAGGYVVGLFGPIAYTAYTLTTLGIGKALGQSKGSILDYGKAVSKYQADMNSAKQVMEDAWGRMYAVRIFEGQHGPNPYTNAECDEFYALIEYGPIDPEDPLGKFIIEGNNIYDQAEAEYYAASAAHQETSNNLSNLQSNALNTWVNGICAAIGLGVTAYSTYRLVKSIRNSRKHKKTMELLSDHINSNKSAYDSIVVKPTLIEKPEIPLTYRY